MQPYQLVIALIFLYIAILIAAHNIAVRYFLRSRSPNNSQPKNK